MAEKATSNARPHGWGAGEILRSMREDAHRFRTPEIFEGAAGSTDDWDDEAITLRDPGSEEP
ncbi:MAG: hypothetical protein R3F14_08825 [Polyangiaceae bacterium]